MNVDVGVGSGGGAGAADFLVDFRLRGAAFFEAFRFAGFRDTADFFCFLGLRAAFFLPFAAMLLLLLGRLLLGRLLCSLFLLRHRFVLLCAPEGDLMK